MNALDVARAALLEVGEDPSMVEWSSLEPDRLAYWGPVVSPVRKAIMLARLAVDGPSFMVRCVRCTSRRTQPCVPVSDALRGLTCGRAS